MNDIYLSNLNKSKVELIEGQARFVGDNEIAVAWFIHTIKTMFPKGVARSGSEGGGLNQGVEEVNLVDL